MQRAPLSRQGIATRIWLAIGLGALVGALALSRVPDLFDLVLWVASTSIAVILAWWTSQHDDRTAYDLGTPLVVVTGLIVGTGFAPLALVGQGLVLAIVYGILHRRSVHVQIMNLGALSLWRFVVGAGLLILAPQTLPMPLSLLAVAAIAATGIAVNYLSVWWSVLYLYDSDRPTNPWPMHFRDMAGIVIPSAAALLAPSWAVVSMALIVAFLVFFVPRWEEQRRLAEVTALRIQTRIIEAETFSLGGLEGHTERVVATLRALAENHRLELAGDALEAAGWFHSAVIPHLPGACGRLVRNADLRSFIDSLPRARKLTGQLESLSDWQNRRSLPTRWVGIACELDNHLHDGARHKGPQAIARESGYNAADVEAVIAAHDAAHGTHLAPRG